MQILTGAVSGGTPNSANIKGGAIGSLWEAGTLILLNHCRFWKHLTGRNGNPGGSGDSGGSGGSPGLGWTKWPLVYVYGLLS